MSTNLEKIDILLTELKKFEGEYEEILDQMYHCMDQIEEIHHSVNRAIHQTELKNPQLIREADLELRSAFLKLTDNDSIDSLRVDLDDGLEALRKFMKQFKGTYLKTVYEKERQKVPKRF